MFSWFKNKPIEVTWVYNVSPSINSGVRWYEGRVSRVLHTRPRHTKTIIDFDYFETREEANNWVAEKRLETKENNDDTSTN